MYKVNELDIAELKVNMRNMYKQIGMPGALQCLYEILLSANILIEVISENIKHE